MKQEPYALDTQRRRLVLQAIQQVCSHYGWALLAAHVRPRHVHFVVVAGETPERILNQVKAYASRALNQAGLDSLDRRRWAHHGSTRYLWKREEVGSAIHYVVREQGKPLEVWENPVGLA